MENNFRPILALVHITDECNLECRHCYSRKQKKELKTDLVFKVIDDLVSMGMQMLHLSGGELFLHGDVFEIISYAKSKGLYLEVTTNGTLLDDELVDRLIRESIDKIVISFDGAQKITHDKIRGGGSFEKSLSGLRLGLSKGLPMAVNYTLMKDNINEIEKAINFFSNFDIKFLNFRRLIATGKGSLEMLISPQEYLEAFRIVNLWRKRDLRISMGGEPHKIFFDADLYNKAKEYGFAGCSAGRFFLSIDASGDVTPCGFLPTRVGNINNDSIVDLWNSAPIFARLRNRENLSGICGSCKDRDVCGGCRASAQAFHNNVMGGDNLCWKNLNKQNERTV